MLTIMFWLKLPGIAHNFFGNAWQPNKNEKCGLRFSQTTILQYALFVCACTMKSVFFFGNDSNQIVALQVYFIQVFMVKQLVGVHM